MFISAKEKSIVNARIDLLEARVNELVGLFEKAKIKLPKEKKYNPREWTDVEKFKASERMKKFWADRKAKKEAS